MRKFIIGTIAGAALAMSVAAFSGNGTWFTCEGRFTPVKVKHEKPWHWDYTLKCGKG